MDVTLVLCMFLVFLLIWCLLNSRKPSGLPPGPKLYPIIGNLNYVYGNKKFHLTLQKLSNKHGKIMSLQMFTQPAVVISDYSLFREALLTKANNFSERPIHLTLLKLLFRNNGLVFQNGDRWERLRRLALRSMRDMGMGKATIEERISDECGYMMHQIESLYHRTPFCPKETFQKSTCNIICSVLFGNRFDYDNAEFIQFLTDLSALFGNGVFQNCAIYLPLVGLAVLLAIQPSVSLMAIRTLRTRQFALRRIQEHRGTFDPDNIRDFVDLYLQVEHENTHDKYTEAMILQTILDLFFAGTETTATALSWTFLFFVKHPEVQERCRQEVLKAVGSSRAPTMNDKPNCSYLRAAISESIRRCMVAPITLHNASEATTLGGYTIPKNTVLVTNFYTLHMDSELWPEPTEFRPERFLDENGVYKAPEYFMPFGLGKRKCMGETLANQELFLVVCNLLQNFRFSCSDISKLPKEEEATMGVTLVPPDYELIAEKIVF